MTLFPPGISEINFPLAESADEDGILAIGGNLQSDTLLKAYRHGAFPWYNKDQPIIWHHPDPRFVLIPNELKVSHSMRNVLNKRMFRFSFDKDFLQVIKNCKTTIRTGEGNESTWITNEIEKAYSELFEKGYAHSAEAWVKDELVGGLYGVLIGKVFFGESMFSHQSNASKFAFIKMVEVLKNNGVELIDCQVYTSHLESLGAKHIPRKDFILLLQELIG